MALRLALWNVFHKTKVPFIFAFSIAGAWHVVKDFPIKRTEAHPPGSTHPRAPPAEYGIGYNPYVPPVEKKRLAYLKDLETNVEEQERVKAQLAKFRPKEQQRIISELGKFGETLKSQSQSQSQ